MLCLLLFVAWPAAAQVACNVSAQGVVFGAYDPSRPTATDGAGNIQVTCTGAVGSSANYTIVIGTGASNSFTPRKLGGAADFLTYNLYADFARTTIWGDGSASTIAVSDAYVLATSSVTRNYPVYGRIFPLQNVRVGSYADAITVTLSF